MDLRDVPQPSGSGAGERKAFEGVRNRAFSPAGLPSVSSSLCPRVGGDKSCPARCPFCWPSFGKGFRVRFVSCRLDIKAVKKAVGEYERITGAKVNFDKIEGLRLGAWRGSNTLPEPFRWSDGPVRILGVCFGPDLQLERNWSEV